MPGRKEGKKDCWLPEREKGRVKLMKGERAREAAESQTFEDIISLEKP